jgi:hypothetical protein
MLHPLALDPFLAFQTGYADNLQPARSWPTLVLS